MWVHVARHRHVGTKVHVVKKKHKTRLLRHHALAHHGLKRSA